MKNLENKYVKIQLPKKLDNLGLVYLEPEYVYFKLGRVYEQENYGAYAVEIEDYVGRCSEVSKFVVMLDDKYLTLINYKSASTVVEIIKEEFQDKLMKAMLENAKELKVQEYINLSFMTLNQPERRDFLYLLNKTV